MEVFTEWRDHGEKVVRLQRALIKYGYLKVGGDDGFFGPMTLAAFLKFRGNLYDKRVVYLHEMEALDAMGSESGVLTYPPQPTSLQGVYDVFGKFDYEEDTHRLGWVVPAKEWVSENLIMVEGVPLIGKLYVHRSLAAIVRAVFKDIAVGVPDFIVRLVGCYAPRHKMSNPKRGLSLHSWAIAIDLNWDTNPVGSKGDMPQAVVDIFKKHGFSWGGNWKSVKDPMHFQYATGV